MDVAVSVPCTVPRIRRNKRWETVVWSPCAASSPAGVGRAVREKRRPWLNQPMDHAGEPSTAGGARRPSLPPETFPTSVSVSSKPSLRTGNCPSCTDSKTARLWGMSGKQLQETGSSRTAFCKNRARVPTKAAAGCRSSGRSSRANAELQTGKSQGCTTSFNIMPLCLRLKWTAASGRPRTEAKEGREHGNLRRIRRRLALQRPPLCRS